MVETRCQSLPSQLGDSTVLLLTLYPGALKSSSQNFRWRLYLSPPHFTRAGSPSKLRGTPAPLPALRDASGNFAVLSNVHLPIPHNPRTPEHPDGRYGTSLFSYGQWIIPEAPRKHITCSVGVLVYKELVAFEHILGELG
jgi:hypothetical protein